MDMTSSGPAIEYRFSATPVRAECPVCGSTFESAMGMWPHIAGTDQLVCGAPDCPVGEEVTRTQPCDTMFEFAELEQHTTTALADAISADGRLPVAEQFRRVSLLPDLPGRDRNLLQLAAIDLQYCQAGGTRIERFEPRIVLRTCGEAAAELLLSGCGDILIEAS
jgi:hypothetical protein